MEKRVQELWSFEMGEMPSSEPVVSERRVLVGSCDGRIFCLDGEKGRKLWEYETKGWVSQPLIDSGYVFFGSHDGRVCCLDLVSGKKRWEFATGGAIRSRPEKIGQEIFIGSEGDRIYCLEAETGTRKSSRRWGDLIWTTKKAGASLYVNALRSGGGGKLSCLDLPDLKVRWSFQSGEMLHLPSVDRGCVYTSDEGGRAYCLREEDGGELWRYKRDWGSAGPVVAWEGKVYGGGQDGKLLCLDGETGEKLWAFQSRGEIGQGPAVSARAIFFGSCDRKIYALNPSGEKRWDFETRDKVTFSPTLDGNRIYVSSLDKNIYCLCEI